MLFKGFHPRFLARLALVWAGALLRLWSYHALGELFTFEVVVKPDHRLITSGPYAHVRHPWCTGFALLLLGMQHMQFGPGGYLFICHSPIPAMASAFVGVGGSAAIRGCGVENGELARKLRDAWVESTEAVTGFDAVESIT